VLNRLKGVFKSFQQHDVKYVVIGGIAAVLYGVPRATFDLDILIEATPENAQRLLDALIDAGMGTATLTNSDEILVDCKRSCAICHKFCGTKIELHHIKPTSEGGYDSYANWMPLCFDCHSEVRAYDEKHPNGRKYSESELKKHTTKCY